jgi:ubiquinone/menaquinone biosynthesis C-methylase UbiE
MAVDHDDKRRRRSSFGTVAASYDEHRPEYAEEAIRWAVAPAGDSVPGLAVLDLGAGTGILTRQLVRLGAAVTAVEPHPGMLEHLRRELPAVPAHAGTAESIPLPDASVRAVLCGQALHWFDLDRALPEIARVLAPGGVLAGLWNDDDNRVEWVPGLHAAAEDSMSPMASVRRTELTEISLGHLNAETPWFEPGVIEEFGNGHRRTADSLLATIMTHSKFLVMAPEKRDEILARVRAYLHSRPETADGEFTLPMVTSVLRAVRKIPG